MTNSNMKIKFDTLDYQTEAVNAAVKERLRQDDPQTGASTGYSKTVNPYAKMRNEQATKKVDAPNPWGN